MPYFSKNYIFMNLKIIQVAHYRCRAGLYLCFMVWLPSIYLLYDCSVYNKFFSKAVCVVIFVAQKKYNILAKSVKMPVLLYKMSRISSEIFLRCPFCSLFAFNVCSCMVFPFLSGTGLSMWLALLCDLCYRLCVCGFCLCVFSFSRLVCTDLQRVCRNSRCVCSSAHCVRSLQWL